jgi:putative peptidoglycan lipid II flippase
MSDPLPAPGLAQSWRKLTTGSVSRQIFGAAATVALLTALVKAVTVGRELVVAWRFGVSDALDAYLIALLLPSFIINVIAGSFNAAFTPTFIRVREQEGEREAQKLFSSVTVWSLGLLFVTTLLMAATAPLYLPLIASGFSREKLDLTFRLLLMVAPVVMLGGMVVIWASVLNAGRRFALAALSPVLTPAISLLFLLAFKGWGIYALVVGLVSGAVLEMIILAAALKLQGIHLLPRWYGADAHLRQVARQYGPMIAAAFFMIGANLVDQSMAAMLSPGSVAALNYGSRVVALPIGLAATALSTAMTPYFSSMVARSDWAGIRHTLKRYLWLIFILSVPLTVLLFLFSEPLVRLLFQRGSFTGADTYTVARVQAFYALQLPFYLAGIVGVRLMSSLLMNNLIFRISAFNLFSDIVLNAILFRYLGVAGIALATSIVYFISCLLIYLALYRRGRLLSERGA